jgi:hypothetical protein
MEIRNPNFRLVKFQFFNLPVSNYGGYPNDNIDDSNATLTI